MLGGMFRFFLGLPTGALKVLFTLPLNTSGHIEKLVTGNFHLHGFNEISAGMISKMGRMSLRSQAQDALYQGLRFLDH